MTTPLSKCFETIDSGGRARQAAYLKAQPYPHYVHVKAHVEEFSTKDLKALQAWVAQTLQAQRWAQHGANPAVRAVLDGSGGNRAETYASMTRPTLQLGRATRIAVAQTPEGVQQILELLTRTEHGVFA